MRGNPPVLVEGGAGFEEQPSPSRQKGCGDAFRKGCVCNKAVLGLNDRSHLVLFRAGVINAAQGGRDENGDLGEEEFWGSELARMGQT